MIISVLTTTAVPQMNRLLDSAKLDYEMKTFLNNLEFAKSLNRGTNYKQEIFANNPCLADKNSNEISIGIDKNHYEILNNMQRVGEVFELPEGFSLKSNESLGNQIELSKSNNGTLTITSKLGEKRHIIFDSVGRWRGSLEPAK